MRIEIHHHVIESDSLFVRLISHQPIVFFYQNKPVTSNQPAVFFSQNKSAPGITNQPNEQAERQSLGLAHQFPKNKNKNKVSFPSNKINTIASPKVLPRYDDFVSFYQIHDVLKRQGLWLIRNHVYEHENLRYTSGFTTKHT
jgi:hypothetical protein